MGAELERDTTLTPAGAGRWRGEIADGWSVGDAPNGGYTLAIALRALADELPHPHPLTATAHYLRPCEAGAVSVCTEVVRVGRTTASGQARLVQGGRERVRVLAAFADLSGSTPGARGGAGTVTVQPPSLPPPAACVAPPATGPSGSRPTVADRVDIRVPPDAYGWAAGVPRGRAEHGAWIRFADDAAEPGTAVSAVGLCVLCDVFPPAAFDLGVVGWVPTVELTVHVRGLPAAGWLRARVASRVLQHGFVEEEVELWDRRDRIVAMSRQLAVARSQTSVADRGTP